MIYSRIIWVSLREYPARLAVKMHGRFRPYIYIYHRSDVYQHDWHVFDTILEVLVEVC